VSNNAKKSSPFDVKTIEALVALMSEHDLGEIYLRDGTQHVRLRRGAAAAGMLAAPPGAGPMLPAAPRTPAPASESKPEAPPPPKKNLLEIKSETVGTFYAQPKPGEPPYVKVGDRVTPNKPVGLVEVMKTYNEILANCSGVIREVLVESGTFVEFNQPLFLVDPDA
jgi:acetyl-CoA carboxylase biotin carboxyl carrier protein